MRKVVQLHRALFALHSIKTSLLVSVGAALIACGGSSVSNSDGTASEPTQEDPAIPTPTLLPPVPSSITPSDLPSPQPTPPASPTPAVRVSPSLTPSASPSVIPTLAPTASPSAAPTLVPTIVPPTPSGSVLYDYATVDTQTTYSDRQGQTRSVPMRVYYPLDAEGVEAPLIIVSHGGTGNPNGKTLFAHLGEEYAAHGFVAAVLSHLPSSGGVADHVYERPMDVSNAIDHLLDVVPLANFKASIQADNIGHIGHSFGAYTSHAVGGVELLQGNLGDERIKAIAPLSPQGPNRFGSFDETLNLSEESSVNSWADLAMPAYNLVGELEVSGDAQGEFVLEDWRLFPFYRYLLRENKYLTILPEAEHFDLGSRGPQDIRTFIADNTRVFFEVYLQNRSNLEPLIGELSNPSNIDTTRGSEAQTAP